MASPDANVSGRKPFARRSWPIALYLLILALVALLPAFIFSAVLLQRNNEAQERVVETLMTGATRSIVQTVEREITANITTLRVLATTPSLLDRNFAAFHARARLGLAGTNTFVFVLDDSFNAIMSTRLDYPSPPTPSNDPTSARTAIDTEAVVVTDLILGAVSKRWVFNILQPIFPPTGPPMVLAMNRDGETLASVLLADKLPDGWNVALVDGRNRVIAGSDPTNRTGDVMALTGIDSLAARPGWVRVEDDGVPSVAMVQKSFLTGWRLVAWAPQDLVTRPLFQAYVTLLVGGLLLAALVVIAIYWVSLQIGRSVHRLEDDAQLLGVGEPVPARNYPISEIANVSQALIQASQRRRAAEVEVRFLMRELAHRSKNQMTVIAAMAKQTAKGADSVPEFVSAFEKRIFGLARSTDLLLAHGAAGVDLQELLTRQIEPFCPVDGRRVRLTGPATRLNMQSAQIVGMAAHELATNAVKYGAFADETGTVTLDWWRTSESLEMLWREQANLQTPRPDRRGFGTTVIENMVGRALGAEVSRTLHEDGIEWRFSIPFETLDPVRDPQADAEPETPQAPAVPPGPVPPAPEK
jgi:two-component sensor histidine kinase